MNCPNCHNHKTQFFFEAQNIHGSRKLSKEKFILLKCVKCGVIFPQVVIDNLYYKKYYPVNYYHSGSFSQNQLLRKYEIFCLNQVKNLVCRFIKKGRVLDFGCGLGQFLSLLPDSDFEKYGIEVNPTAVFLIKKNNPQIKIFSDFSSLIRKSLKFDLITLWHVLEHLENPKETLNQLVKLMNKNAVLFIATPNSQSLGLKIGQDHWFHLDTPRHLAIYNLECLTELCHKAGLEISLIRDGRFEYPLDLFWSIYNRYKTERFFLNIPIAVFSLLVNMILKILYIFKPERTEVITVCCRKK